MIKITKNNWRPFIELTTIAEDGEELYDYPIPEVERMDINHSTEIATDEYHTRYRIIWTK